MLLVKVWSCTRIPDAHKERAEYWLLTTRISTQNRHSARLRHSPVASQCGERESVTSRVDTITRSDDDGVDPPPAGTRPPFSTLHCPLYTQRPPPFTFSLPPITLHPPHPAIHPSSSLTILKTRGKNAEKSNLVREWRGISVMNKV